MATPTATAWLAVSWERLASTDGLASLGSDVVQFLWEQAAAHPVHVAIEATFVLIFVYFVMMPVHRAKRAGVAAEQAYPTAAEEQEMVAEFASRPFEIASATTSNVNGCVPVVVLGSHNAYVTIAASELVAAAARNHASGGAGGATPAATSKARALSSSPAARASSSALTLNGRSSSGAAGAAATVDVLNLSSFDVLCLGTHADVVAAAKAAVRAYGVGSCGPRGFYGSSRPHLDMEAHLARFLGTHSAIVYSYAFATSSTLIPCFSSRGDTLLCDAGANLVLQQGCYLSRSLVTRFRHNDTAHLAELMEAVAQREGARGGRLGRRFVVTEGLFRNTGDVCPLPEIVRLCRRFKFRLILDDSIGFGVLGATGRGTPEHFFVPMSDVDVYVGSLSCALGSVGGFCAGADMVVDHQRLAATGYVFSAALPPYTTVAASRALRVIEESPAIVLAVQRTARTFRRAARAAGLPSSVAMVECVTDASPVVHFTATPAKTGDAASAQRAADDALQRAADLLLVRDRVLAQRALYNSEDERTGQLPSLRLVLKGGLSDAEATRLAQRVVDVLRSVFA